jgi:HEAT repeat protein
MAAPLRRRRQQEQSGQPAPGQQVPRRVESPLPPAEVARRQTQAAGRQADVAGLLTMLQGGDARSRIDAARQLGRVGGAQAVPALMERLSDQEPGVRESAAYALGSIGDSRARDALASRLDRGERNPACRAAIAWSLGSMGPLDERALTILMSEASSGPPPMRIAAEHALGGAGDSRAIPILIAGMGYAAGRSNDPDRPGATSAGSYGVRNEAVSALVSLALRQPETGRALMEALGDADPNIRMNAAKALGRIGDAAAVPGLIGRAGSDDDMYVRMASAEALGLIGDRRAVEALSAFVSGGPRGEVADRARGAAAEALGRLGDGRASDTLIGALDDSSEIVRMAAIRALGRLRDRRAVAPLTARLEGDRFESLRSAAALALGFIGGSEARSALGRASREGTPSVRTAAGRALSRMPP